jgi:hypothetical protein
MNSKNKNVKKFNADMQNQPFQIPVFPQMLNRHLVEQLDHSVLGATTLYQAQSQMRDVPCKCSLLSGGAHGFVANKCAPTWRFVRNQILSLYKQSTIIL